MGHDPPSCKLCGSIPIFPRATLFWGPGQGAGQGIFWFPTSCKAMLWRYKKQNSFSCKYLWGLLVFENFYVIAGNGRGSDSEKGKPRIGVEKGGTSIPSEISKPFREVKELFICFSPPPTPPATCHWHLHTRSSHSLEMSTSSQTQSSQTAVKTIPDLLQSSALTAPGIKGNCTESRNVAERSEQETYSKNHMKGS
jgi:hypothetical protein